MEAKIKIGTRGSKLALWQAYHVASLLEAQGLSSEIVVVETKGDKNLNQPFAEIGTKGIFTEEIEAKLISAEIDIAVHSAKDLQSTLPEDLEILAFLAREEPNDVLVSIHPEVSYNNISKLTIGTSSARRRALLQHYFPGISLAESRGNLQTRIRKMEEGQCDALILAYAGIHRMNYDHLIREKLSLIEFTPAVAQGSIAIEASKKLHHSKRDIIKKILNDPETEYCLNAERSFLRELEGGCSIPIFCLATLASGALELQGGIVSPSGGKIIRKTLTGTIQQGELLGKELATFVVDNGGLEILKEIRK